MGFVSFDEAWQMELAGEVALVMDAGSGIGRATALQLAREGAAIAVLSQDGDKVDKVVRDIRGAGGRAIGLNADVSDADQMRQAVDQLASELGRLDIIFANHSDLLSQRRGGREGDQASRPGGWFL